MATFYQVVPLSQRSGIVEWCEGTMPIGIYLVGRGKGGAHARYRPQDKLSLEVRETLKACKNRTSELLTVRP